MKPLKQKQVSNQTVDSTGQEIPATPRFRRMADFLAGSSVRKKRCHENSGTPDMDRSGQVEVVQEEGVVKRILVTCGCGEVIEIDCHYDSR